MEYYFKSSLSSTFCKPCKLFVNLRIFLFCFFLYRKCPMALKEHVAFGPDELVHKKRLLYEMHLVRKMFKKSNIIFEYHSKLHVANLHGRPFMGVNNLTPINDRPCLSTRWKESRANSSNTCVDHYILLLKLF